MSRSRSSGFLALLLLTLGGGVSPVYAQSAVVTADSTQEMHSSGAALDDGSGMRLVTPPELASRILSDQEHAARAAEKPATTQGVAFPPTQTPPLQTAATLNALSSMGTALTEVIVQLDETDFDFSALRTADDLSRFILIAQRQAEVAGPQQTLAQAIRTLGGTVDETFWIVNQVRVTVPASAGRTIANLPGVKAVLRNGVAIPTLQGYSGVEIRNGTLAHDFIANGIVGAQGNRTNANLAINAGIIESWYDSNNHENLPSWHHDAFYTGTGSGTWRWGSVRDCTWGSTCPTVYLDPDEVTHNTVTTGLFLASIEAGQDPNYPVSDPTDEVSRSGIMSGAKIAEDYLIFSCTDLVNALQDAVSRNLDIVNMSIAIANNGQFFNCWTGDCAGVNAAIANLTNAGTLIVAAAGNGGQPGSCTLGYPGIRSEVIGVTGLQTWPQTVNYTTSALYVAGSEGGLPVVTSTGYHTTAAGLGIAAPAVVNDLIGMAPNSYYYTDTGGTSVASPIVAGIAGLVRNAFTNIGWYPDARLLKANVLLLGDSVEYTDNPSMCQGNFYTRASAMSYCFGAGRMRARFPSSNDLVGPWEWEWRYFPITNHQDVSYLVYNGVPVPQQVTQWKWVLEWDEPDFSNIADVDIHVYNTCPPGGGQVQIASQTDYDYRNRITLSGSAVQGACLSLEVYGYNVPSGGRMVYSAYFFHSGSL